MSVFGSLVGAAPYFADVVERDRQRKRQAVADKLAQDQSARVAQLTAAQIAHLNAQTGAVRPPPTPRDPVADHAANRDYDINHPLPTRPLPPVRDPIADHKAIRDYDVTHPLPVQPSYTPVTLGGGNGEPPVVKPFNTKTGETGPVIGEAKPVGTGKVSATITKAIAENNNTLTNIQNALHELDAHPSGVGLGRGLPVVGKYVDQRIDPQGNDLRTDLANIGSLQIHDRTGATMSLSEEPRLSPFIPSASDTPEKIRSNLTKLAQGLKDLNMGLGAGASGGSARTLSPEDAAHAQRDPNFAAWLRSKGYEVP